jgi:hypothetical protein
MLVLCVTQFSVLILVWHIYGVYTLLHKFLVLGSCSLHFITKQG